MSAPPKFDRILTDVAAYVGANPGCTRSEIAAMVVGANGSISVAVDRLIRDGRIEARGRRLHPQKRARR